jgi:DNA-directed RNA polymerase subunit alpha
MAKTRIPLPPKNTDRELAERLALPIAQTRLPLRVVNCLEEAGMVYVKDLLQRTPEELLAIPNLGERTLRLILRRLGELGFATHGTAGDRTT